MRRLEWIETNQPTSKVTREFVNRVPYCEHERYRYKTYLYRNKQGRTNTKLDFNSLSHSISCRNSLSFIVFRIKWTTLLISLLVIKNISLRRCDISLLQTEHCRVTANSWSWSTAGTAEKAAMTLCNELTDCLVLQLDLEHRVDFYLASSVSFYFCSGSRPELGPGIVWHERVVRWLDPAPPKRPTRKVEPQHSRFLSPAEAYTTAGDILVEFLSPKQKHLV